MQARFKIHLIPAALASFIVVAASIYGAYKVTGCVHRRMFMQ